MNLPAFTRYEKQEHKDVCPKCGSWAFLVSACDPNTKAVILEWCEVCLLAVLKEEP